MARAVGGAVVLIIVTLVAVRECKQRVKLETDRRNKSFDSEGRDEHLRLSRISES
jgi:hypothetical protein